MNRDTIIVSTELFSGREVVIAACREDILAQMVCDNLDASAHGLPEVHMLADIIECCGMCTPARGAQLTGAGA